MGNGVLLLFMGVAVAINLIIIKIKIEGKRFFDAFLDGGVLVALSFVFGSSFSGLVTATVASSIVSLYLWKNPPKITGRSDIPSLEPKGHEHAAITDFKSSWSNIMNDLRENKP